MKITLSLFEAHLKCPTKCWLRSNGEPTAGNAYAEWVHTQSESYRADAVRQLAAEVPMEVYAVGPAAENLKTAKWRLAVDMDILAQVSTPAVSGSVPLPERKPDGTPPEAIGTDGPSALQSRLHAVERIRSKGRGKAAQFIPIRFIFTNKLGKDDKLLLAFDAFVIAEMLGREIRLGKIIHGDDHAMLKVKTSALTSEVRKRIEKIAALLSNPARPDLVLNRHCAECEFQARCRQKAIEFARLRDVIEGSSTEKGIREYLILLSICQTCKYMGADFLDFLRSGERDIHAFAESRRTWTRPSRSSQPIGLPTITTSSPVVPQATVRGR